MGTNPWTIENANRVSILQQRQQCIDRNLCFPLDPDDYNPPELKNVSLQSIRESRPDFKDFESCPEKALTLFHVNTGIAHYDFSDREQLKQDIGNEELTEQDRERITNNVHERR
jgi:hypothetical protein